MRWRTDEETGRVSFAATLEPEDAALMPDWAGDPLTSEGIDVIVDHYVSNRATDADRHAAHDPRAAAAA